MSEPLRIWTPEGARVSTTAMQTSYYGTGVAWGNTRSRSWVRNTIREHLRVAESREDRHRVMDVWKRHHYLADGRSPFKPKTTHISYILDMPGWVMSDPPGIPSACASLIYCKPGGIRPLLGRLGCTTTMQVMELVRNFVADDVREIPDFSPRVLREIVRRMRQGDDWERNNARLENSCRSDCRPRWLITYADPAVGHDGGLYRGAGAEEIGESASGKLLFGWPLYLS